MQIVHNLDEAVVVVENMVVVVDIELKIIKHHYKIVT